MVRPFMGQQSYRCQAETRDSGTHGLQIRRAVDGPSAGADWGSVPGGGWGVGVDGSDLRGPWLGELLCGNLGESFKFLTC